MERSHDEHNPDTNKDWRPKIARRVYACMECGQEVELTTNHVGVVWAQRCTGTCRHIINPHTEFEQVMPKATRHRYIGELVPIGPGGEGGYAVVDEREA